MKNILFVIPAFTVGGTNTSLISLLPFIDREKYKISVYAMNPSGPMGREIAKYCTVINRIGRENTIESTSSYLNAIIRRPLKSIKNSLGSIGIDLTQIYYRRQVSKLSKTHYDCVIAFQEGEATRFVQFFKGTRKAAWVRSAYARYLAVTNAPAEDKLYERFDVIVNVSETAMNGFLEVMPQCREKSVFIYNLVNKERIISLSKIDISFPRRDELFTIVSLGRVDKVKHFSEIPGIAMRLKNEGIHFRWIIIGGTTVRYPEEFESLKRSIADENLEKYVIMLGHQSNPYPYLAKSDLLVCLSESETFNHTFAEARTLGVPVLSVNYIGADEFLVEGQGGMITSRESICNELLRIIRVNDYYSDLKSQAERYSYDNDSQLNKLYKDVIG